MRSTRLIQVVAAVLILAGALFLPSCLEAPAEEAGTAAVEPQRVETAAVGTADVASTLRFAGTVRSARRTRVSFSVAGRLLERPVVAGDRVRAGQRLGRLESEELGNALSAAEAAGGEAMAQAEQAERELRRVERLVDAKAATAEELERARTAAEARTATVRRAEAAADEARRRARESVVTAPWDGTVTEVMAQPGEYLAAGDPLLELAGADRPEIEVRVPETYLRDLAPGQEVEVVLPFAANGGSRLRGTVVSAGAAAGGPGRLFPVLVALPPGSGVVSGQAAEVLLESAAAGGLSLPLTAVLNPGGSRPVVFRVERDGAEGNAAEWDGAGDGVGTDAVGPGAPARAVEVPVRVGELTGERVVVTADGLSPGDHVVVAGHLGLIDGDPVVPIGRVGGAPLPATATSEAVPPAATPAADASVAGQAADRAATGARPGAHHGAER